MTFQLTTWAAAQFAGHRSRPGLGDEVLASAGEAKRALPGFHAAPPVRRGQP
jgi:hypothetical protein